MDIRLRAHVRGAEGDVAISRNCRKSLEIPTGTREPSPCPLSPSVNRVALDNSKDSVIMGSGSQYGAYTDITDPLSKKRNAIAADYYEQVRNRDRTYEIAAVARNTGFSKNDVVKVFAHIFEKEHLFEDGECHRFHPDYYMQHSWMRLREGKNIQNHDLTLLYHELAEATLMESNPSITYERAHEEASKEFNYLKDLLEYLKYHDA